MNVMDFFEAHSVALAFLATLVAGVFKFWQYVDVRRSEERERRFQNYHKLIERLNAPLPGHEDAYLNVQQAAVFELRNYKEYKEVTKDIFSQWIERESRLAEGMKKTLKKLGY